MRHVLIELPEHGTSTAAHLADLGHRRQKFAALLLLHAVVHGFHHPAARAAQQRHQFGGRRLRDRQRLGRVGHPPRNGQVNGEAAHGERQPGPDRAGDQ